MIFFCLKNFYSPSVNSAIERILVQKTSEPGPGHNSNKMLKIQQQNFYRNIEG